MDQKSPLSAKWHTALERIVDLCLSAGPVSEQSDKYFTNTSLIVASRGDSTVTYAVFMRRRVIAALEPAVRLITRLVPEARIRRYFEDGDLVPSEVKMMEITGPMSRLSEMETLFLQKIGFPCVTANNAYEMCLALPESSFLDMHARHGTGADMNLLASYGAAVGSLAAQRINSGVRGFVGSSQDLTASFFGAEEGMGTMPHALVGFTGGDVLAALKLFAETLPNARSLVALVDYTGHEISDSLRCAEWFFNEAALDRKGKTFGVRLDTHGGRFAEGLDYERSVDLVGEWLNVSGEYNIVERVLGQRAFQLDPNNILVDKVRRVLFGKGVSVASIIHARRSLDASGFTKTEIVGSSGFDPQKCQVMGAANAPIDMVGTGSFLPATLTETYATADIIAYDGVKRVKVGREFLFD
jgi:nicotinate phosphoribosyltransferase